ncbi:hypothetical protein [Pyxidicoccus trucidator]|uniref:hypothetical protein n=1 Tax=Pyxidicoccus trucidator TaxID=2709662 RepID=UPI0013DD26A7|nr:hypothetical protein [Pyxidicoccus trucidator]
MRLFVRCLPLAGVILLASCGGLRQGLAEEGFLQQQLYDYSYDVPLDSLWTEAKAVTGALGGEEGTEGGVRTFSVSARMGDAHEPGSSGLHMRGWEVEGRGYLHIFRVRYGDPAPHPADLSARAVDLEMKLLERFHPEDARKFQEGAHRAGQRAR